YDLAASVVGGHGTVSPVSGSYAAGAIVDLTADADSGYRVKQWTGTDNDSLKTSANQVTMNSNKTVTVEFEVIPSIIYVDDDGPGEPLENGSQTYPYDTIQEAVNIVPADGTVIVMDGTYSGAGNNMINFNGKDLIIQSQNGPAGCIIDCEFGSQGFYLESNETNDSVVQGFTITRGYAFYGGAIYISNASPTIKDCIITGNQAYGSNTGGGGIHCSTASPIIQNCIFSGNSAYHFGGAIQARLMSNITIIDSKIIENSAGNVGGGVYLKQSTAAIKNTRLSANQAVYGGGGIYSSEADDVGIINCTINDSRTNGDGGGVYCYISSPDIRNTIFSGNNKHAVFEWDSASDPNVTYCLFHNNPDGDYYDNDTSATYTGAVNINTNVTQASYNIDGDPLYAVNGFWDDNGTAEDANDDFWTDGDYHIQAQEGRWAPDISQWVYDAVTSPCVDGGAPNSDWTKELWPHGKRINIGVYGGTCQGSMSDSSLGSASDFDNDGVTDTKDLGIFGESWLDEDAALLPGDIHRDGQMNLLDFANFANEWGQPAD
ncbi:MAG: right-handed parallel beta-helix repeat-containing protein, partial [Phycisphaerae bacterium]|nr:right-handed parallel beta-helix repeat-containing protein [Phycisphaerae bacterium]